MLLNLSQLRKDRNLSQAELAKIFSVNQNTISRWEKGDRSPDPEQLKTIAQYFGVSVDYIIGNEEPKKKIPKDLKKILDEEELALNGRLMTAEDKEKIKRIIEAAYWDAKEMNKHTKDY